MADEQERDLDEDDFDDEDESGEEEHSWREELRQSDRPRHLKRAILGLVAALIAPFKRAHKAIDAATERHVEALVRHAEAGHPQTGAEVSRTAHTLITEALGELEGAVRESHAAIAQHAPLIVNGIAEHVTQTVPGAAGLDVHSEGARIEAEMRRYLQGRSQEAIEAVHQALTEWHAGGTGDLGALREAVRRAVAPLDSYARTVATAEVQNAYVRLFRQATRFAGTQYVRRTAMPGACLRCAELAGVWDAGYPDLYWTHPHCMCTWCAASDDEAAAAGLTDSQGGAMKLSAEARAALSASDFLDEKRREFPVHDHAHWEAAGMAIDHAHGYTDAERESLRAKWRKVGKAKGWFKGDTSDAFSEILTDTFESEIEVIEDAAEKPMRLRVLLTKANVRNKNRRVYPKHVLEDMVSRGQKKLRDARAVQQRFLMEKEHPPAILDAKGHAIGFGTNGDGAIASVIDALYMTGGNVFIDTTLLDTPAGQAIADLVRAGRKPPVSLRSLGRTRRASLNGDPTNIATFLDWHGGDWVDNPALPDAGPEEVLTDAQIEQALDSAEEETNMELEQLKAQLKALTDAKDADKAKVKELEDKIEKLEMERDKIKPGKADEKDDEVKDSIATLSAQVKALQDSLAAEQNAKKADSAKAEVKAFADSLEANADLKRFSADMRKEITARVSRAADKTSAEQALTDAVADMDRAIAAAKLAGMGHTPAAEAAATAGRTTHVQVVNNPTPWKAVVDKMDAAFSAHRKLSNAPSVDESIRTANKKVAEQMLDSFAEREGKALTDSAQAVLDGVVNDSTTGDMWNQPTIAAALVLQQFQEMEALQFAQGIGPNGFEQGTFNNEVGSILRVPVEYRQAPQVGGLNTYNPPYYNNNMSVAEGAAIPTLSLKLAYLVFAPAWKKAAFQVSDEVVAALKNGPLNYDVWARHMYHLTLLKAQIIDMLIYETMLQTSSETNAVAVANETVNSAQWTYSAGGSVGGYGSGVVGVAQLLCGGTTAAPNKQVPIVKPRVSTDLTSSGQVTTTTLNPLTLGAINGVTQVQGYLDANNNIAQIPGSAAPTYAVDWLNGKLVFNAASGADGTHLPTVSAYTYETNFDVFTLSNPTLQSGQTYEQFLNGLLRQVDGSAAYMGSSPRFMPPNLGIMSLNAANSIQNASTFYKWVSPEGSKLSDPRIVSNSKFAERNGIELAKINTPWSAGDSRILLGRQGAAKYGIDRPWQVEGPYPGYDTATGMPNGTKLAYGAENSVVCVPQATDQSGKILNPALRSIVLR